jgi:hypothetical protein
MKHGKKKIKMRENRSDRKKKREHAGQKSKKKKKRNTIAQHGLVDPRP